MDTQVLPVSTDPFAKNCRLDGDFSQQITLAAEENRGYPVNCRF